MPAGQGRASSAVYALRPRRSRGVGARTPIRSPRSNWPTTSLMPAGSRLLPLASAWRRRHRPPRAADRNMRRQPALRAVSGSAEGRNQVRARHSAAPAGMRVWPSVIAMRQPAVMAMRAAASLVTMPPELMPARLAGHRLDFGRQFGDFRDVGRRSVAARVGV